MRFKKEHKPLLPDEERVFSQIVTQLKFTGWDGIKHLDENCGWIILADRPFSDYGIILRRINPFQIKKGEDWEKAKKLQEILRRDLIEIHPYKLARNSNGTRKVKFYEPLFSL